MGRQLMHTSGGITKSRKKEGKSEREKKKEARLCFMNQIIPVGKLKKKKLYIHKYKSARIHAKEGYHDMMGRRLSI